MISNTKKIFKPFNEENIHYRRGLGLIVVKRQMESALKRPFRSYGKPDRLVNVKNQFLVLKVSSYYS